MFPSECTQLYSETDRFELRINFPISDSADSGQVVHLTLLTLTRLLWRSQENFHCTLRNRKCYVFRPCNMTYCDLRRVLNFWWCLAEMCLFPPCNPVTKTTMTASYHQMAQDVCHCRRRPTCVHKLFTSCFAHVMPRFSFEGEGGDPLFFHPDSRRNVNCLSRGNQILYCWKGFAKNGIYYDLVTH